MSRAAKSFLIFSANYLPNIGGVEKYTKFLAEQLVNEGDHVTVVTNNVFDLPTRETTDAGVELVRLPCRPLLKGRYPLPKRNAVWRAEYERLLGLDVDYVVVNTRFYPHTLVGLDLAERKGVKPILIDHGSAHLTMGNAVVDVVVAGIEHFFTRIVKQHDVDFYGVSNASVRWLEHFGIDALGVLNNSIDARRFVNAASPRAWREELGLGEDDFVVAFTGRLIPEKGIASLVECAQLLIDHSDICFLLAGDGPLREYAEQASSCNLRLLGNLSASDVASLLLASDVFCLPTRSEGFSTSLLEAAACSTAPILPNVGGVEELISSRDHGVVLDSTSGDEVARAILALHDDREETKRIAGNVCKRVFAEFSWEKTAEKVRAACERANPASMA